jgi:Bpu10I restriction endonuclease
MNNQELIAFLNTLDLSVYKHASNIIAKFGNWTNLSQSQKNALPIIAYEYTNFINANNQIIGYSEENIISRTVLLNNYYNFINVNQYDNFFTSQGKFRPTILEEFMYILFKDLINEVKVNLEDAKNNLRVGSTRAYTNLFFSGSNFQEFVNSPQIGINDKDQDFAIYRPISITIGDSNSINTNLPIVAIENKTYIDKTMLEGSIATAEKVKSGNPYSLFFIVTENYDVDLKVDPIYSKIDQIYVLRKSKRAKNQPMQPIYSDVLVDLVSEVRIHLTRNWSDVSAKLSNTGKII